MESKDSTVTLFDVFVTATLERFSLYANAIKAKLIYAAAELEQVAQPDAIQSHHSPNRVTTMQELHHINECSTRLQQSSFTTKIGQIAARQYLDLKQTSLSIPSQADKRTLFTEQHHDTVTEKKPNTLEVDSNISLPPKPIIQKQLKKKTCAIRKTKNIKWETVEKTIINTAPIMGKIDEYLNHYLCNHFLVYMKRSSNKTKGMSTYSCELSSKSNQWGLCRMQSEIIRLPTIESGFDV